MAASLAASVAPRERAAQPPTWLLPEQVRSFRRALAALDLYGGALLADSVGTGKTYVALAVASNLNQGTTACLVPAMLLNQWKETAARLDVSLALWSHERVSRGQLPEGTRGLVIVDESHHFRNPRTHRYRHLAPWLIGRPALLVTATPIVNSTRDLAHQLLLAVRDDALAPDGIRSILAMLSAGCGEQALGKLVLENEAVVEQRPVRRLRHSQPTKVEAVGLTHQLSLLGQLQLSSSSAIAALIRSVLLRALSSSPAAFAGALRRYRRLLLCARDAREAGQPMNRAELRRFTRELGDQLVWWELLPGTGDEGEIELADLPQLECSISEADDIAGNPDGKLERLRCILEDATPTIVFTAFRDTVRYLRDRLGDLRIAWCTGERAGVGHASAARQAVVGLFRSTTSASLTPRHLIVTDVAAEGLDLQRAGRIVHYDLPWTPMRLEQREGRSVRYGSEYSEVEVIQFALPGRLERQLRLERMLARKAKLPAAAGIGPHGHGVWRWRAELARRYRDCAAAAGVATVEASKPGLLAGFALHRSGVSASVASTIVWLEPNGHWTEEPMEVSRRLADAARQHRIAPVEPALLSVWLARLAPYLRERLALARSRRWMTSDQTSATRKVMDRLQLLIREAARSRQAARLAEYDRALAVVAGGHTAGERILIERIAEASTAELVARITRLPPPRFSWDGLEIRLTGLVVFRPAQGSTPPLASRGAQTPDRIVRPRWDPD